MYVHTIYYTFACSIMYISMHMCTYTHIKNSAHTYVCTYNGLTLKVTYSFTNSKYEGLWPHTPLKDLTMAPCKLPCTILTDRKIAL